MPRPNPNITLPVRLAHSLTIVLFVLLTATGLRLAWATGQEWLSPELRALIDLLLPAGDTYTHHTLFGVTFAAVGFFYSAWMIMSGENRRLTNLFHRYEYSFTKKIIYLGAILLAATAIITGFSIYTGIYQGGPGYLFNSFLHQWSWRLLALFAILHTAETIAARRGRIDVIFLGKRFIGFIQWPPMIVAAAIAIVGGAAFHQVMQQPQTLTCRLRNVEVEIDGYALDHEWAGVDSLVIQTHGGANFAYHAAPVTVRTFRNRQRVFFLLEWPDDTRSLNRHLIKTDTGWIPEASAFLTAAGEDIYYEDQAALYFSRTEDCASTCHIGAGERLGIHATTQDTADIWVWMAVSTNPTAEADDRYWIPAVDEVRGGRLPDNKAAGGYRHNLDTLMGYPYFVPTHRIFRDWLLYGAPGYAPYDDQADTFSVGSRIPAVLVAPTAGDRGDVKARGIWRDGRWTLELSRSVSTGSGADLPFTGELRFGIALFDNAEKQHSYHLKPIRLVIE